MSDQYERVEISLLKTSSAYYAKQRALEEKRYCAYCGEQLVRRFYCDGRYESKYAFLKRKFCCRDCQNKARAEGLLAERNAKIAKKYRKCSVMEGLYVDREGNFLYHGKEKKVSYYTYVNGQKRTALVNIMQNKKMKNFQASRLVCEAFKKDYTPDCMIEYIDGDIHNIAASNLRIISKEEYHKTKAFIAASHRKQGTCLYQINRLRNVVSGAMAVLNYFETGNINEVHRVIKEEVYPTLVDWCIHSLCYKKQRAEERVTDAVARFYEVILSGHAVSYPERYCKMLLLKEKKFGHYTHKGNVPREILLIVEEMKKYEKVKK